MSCRLSTKSGDDLQRRVGAGRANGLHQRCGRALPRTPEPGTRTILTPPACDLIASDDLLAIHCQYQLVPYIPRRCHPSALASVGSRDPAHPWRMAARAAARFLVCTRYRYRDVAKDLRYSCVVLEAISHTPSSSGGSRKRRTPSRHHHCVLLDLPHTPLLQPLYLHLSALYSHCIQLAFVVNTRSILRGVQSRLYGTHIFPSCLPIPDHVFESAASRD